AGEATATLDVRSPEDSLRTAASRRILESAVRIAERRRLKLDSQTRLEQAAVPCDTKLTNAMAQAVEQAGFPVHRMPSGAGHDAMVMASRTPVAMLFMRSPGGISHHSAETVRVEDVAACIQAGWHFLMNLNERYA